LRISHGVGRSLHEGSQVSHPWTPWYYEQLRPGVVSPVWSLSQCKEEASYERKVMQQINGQPVWPADGSRSAQFEAYDFAGDIWETDCLP